MEVSRRSVAVATALAAVLVFGATAHAQNKCSSGKVKLAGKNAAAVLGCFSKAAGKGDYLETAAPGCVAKANSKFTAGSMKLDAKSVAPNECPAGTSDDGTLGTIISAHALLINASLGESLLSGLGADPFTLNRCTTGKIKLAGKLDAAVLGCYSKALKKGTASQVETFAPGCLAKRTSKFQAGMAKLEAKPPCLTIGDTASIQDKVIGHDRKVVGYYGATATCPTRIAFTGTSTNGVLDRGWTGNSHDATIVSGGTVTVNVTACAGPRGFCGLCGYTGPVENALPAVQVHRCLGDSSIQCTTDGDCGANAPCVFFFGSYLPLSAGGVATCMQNSFAGPLTGTMDLDYGQSTGSAALTSRVFISGDLSKPCPQCNGGTCSGGARDGMACTVSGSSPNIAFGSTSLDCPPSAGALVGTPIDLSNTTGTKIRTLTAANPNCRAFGYTAQKCQCDTCNNAAATPCSSNADCGAGICGGKRCIGGANAGTACSANSECPGGACDVPGAPTAPNQCANGSGDCVADSGNERICLSGPFENFCGPVETFRGCGVDSNCPYPGDTCSVGRFRDCFDNGVIGETVSASGLADLPGTHQSDPTLASMSCIGPTAYAPVNAVAGFPGLGRLELQGHAVDNGVDF